MLVVAVPGEKCLRIISTVHMNFVLLFILIILAGLPASILAPLQRVFHAAARLVNGLRPHDHVSATLPIKQRVDYKLCLLVHKVVVGHTPSYLTGMLTAVTDRLSHRGLYYSSSCVQRRLCTVVPRTRLKFGERAFSVAAPQAWNRLPTELKLMRSTPAFKNILLQDCLL